MSSGVTKPLYRRMLFVKGLFAFVIFAVLVVQLFNLQVLQHDKYQQLAVDQQTAVISVEASRGTIYDRNGIALAESATAYKVYIVPNKIADEDKQLIIDELSQILSVEPSKIENAVSKTESSYVAVARRIEPDVATAVRTFIKDNELNYCINVTDDPKRYYPFGSLASHVIGFTGDDNQGLYGIEAQYDSYLSGTAGRIISAIVSGGNKFLIPYDYEMYIAPENGNSLMLTIDQTVQYTLENYLREYQEQNGSRNRSASVIMNVKTGEILAMATMPDYDLNAPFTLTDFYSEKLEKDGENRTDLLYEMWRNKVVSEIYEPGSVFKTVTAAIALELKLAKTSDSFYCPGYHMVGGLKIRCAKRSGHGSLDFMKALAVSCNPSFMMIAERIGNDNMYDFVHSLGIGSKTGIDLPSEEAGFFFTKNNYNATELATSSFGQQFKVSMIQMLQIVASFANGGTLVKPHVVKEILSSDGSVIETVGTTEVKQIISEETAKEVMEMMIGVVEAGTGTNARVEGYIVGGKSGTSEKLDKRNENGEVWLYVNSFVTVAPADDPEIIILTAFDEPLSTSSSNKYNSPARFNKEVLETVLPYLGFEPNKSDNSDTVTVGKYVGSTVTESKKAIAELGLNVKVVGTGEDIKYQLPAKGEKLSKGSTVTLYTSSVESIKAIEVPDVTGLPLEEAKSILNEKGFNIKLKENYKDLKDTVVSAQSIPGGEVRPAGQLITLELYYVYEDYENVFN
ncbi:MAG: PASTA domain-containing protein [Clostridia bacterium]|nr:PASTA domain-containing protein [Clostridia bacterium]